MSDRYRDYDRDYDRRGGRDRDRDRDRGFRDDRDRDRGHRDDRRDDRRDDEKTERAPRRRRRNKPSAWDQAPSIEAMGAMVGAAAASAMPGADAARMQALMGLGSGGAPVTSIHSQIRQAKRLYVGNLPRGANEHTIMGFFRHCFQEAKLLPPGIGDPVTEVSINYDKGFCFIEVLTPELATKAIGFDGMLFDGNPIRVKRPKDYIPPPEGDPAGDGAGMIPEGPNKVFVGGLPIGLNEAQVRELLSEFGELRAFHLVMDHSANVSKGFGFCEWADPSVTDRACEALNGMELQGRRLQVQRSQGGSLPLAAMMGAPMYPPKAAGMLNMSIPLAVALGAIVPPTEKPVPSRVLMLLNITSIEALEKDDEVQFLKMDLAKECEQHGKVKEIYIPRPGVPEDADCLGRVFVEYETVEDAMAAQKKLAGRRYNFRCVLTSYCPEEMWEKRIFDPEKLKNGAESTGDKKDGDDKSDANDGPKDKSAPPPVIEDGDA